MTSADGRFSNAFQSVPKNRWALFDDVPQIDDVSQITEQIINQETKQ